MCWLSDIIDGFDFAAKSSALAGPRKSLLFIILEGSIGDNKNVHKDTQIDYLVLKLLAW